MDHTFDGFAMARASSNGEVLDLTEEVLNPGGSSSRKRGFMDIWQVKL